MTRIAFILIAALCAAFSPGCYSEAAYADVGGSLAIQLAPQVAASNNLKLAANLRNDIVQQIQIEIDADNGANSAGSLVICSDASAQSDCASYVAGSVCTGASTVLAELAFSAPSAPSASAGVLTFSTITADSVANATGTASWFTILDQPDDASAECIYTGTVGTSGSDINLNTTSIVANATVSVTSATVTAPGA